jgi:hypothetical protein
MTVQTLYKINDLKNEIISDVKNRSPNSDDIQFE